MIGGVGQRMLTSVSKRMAGEFFGNVDKALAGDRATTARSSRPRARRPARGRARLHRPQAAAAGSSSKDDFVKGIASAPAWSRSGVVLGGIFGRKRR